MMGQPWVQGVKPPQIPTNSQWVNVLEVHGASHPADVGRMLAKLGLTLDRRLKVSQSNEL